MDTRGSRSTLRRFLVIAMWPLTISSPSRPIQTIVVCGLPSGLRVVRWARCPDVSAARTSDVIVMATSRRRVFR